MCCSGTQKAHIICRPVGHVHSGPAQDSICCVYSFRDVYIVNLDPQGHTYMLMVPQFCRDTHTCLGVSALEQGNTSLPQWFMCDQMNNSAIYSSSVSPTHT